MGYAIVMFGVLLAMSLVVVTAYNYGIAKDSEVAPLKAENIYAERETGKAQTGMTIMNTCLSDSGVYVKGTGSASSNGPHRLHLTVRNNGSIVLNSTKATILYNNSYSNFEVTSGNVWPPLKNATMIVSNLYIDNNIPQGGPQLRLLLAAENGVTTIAPTSPTNFSGQNNGNTSFDFWWNASIDDKGIAYYIVYKFESNPDLTCPKTPDLTMPPVPGNQTNLFVTIPCPPPCKNKYIYAVAVDVDGNMGIPSRTIKCPGSADNPCSIVGGE